MTNFIPICIVPRLVEIGPFSGLWLWKKARFRTVFAFMLFSSFDRRTDDGRMKGNPKSLIRESSIRVILKVWNLSNNNDTVLYCRAKLKIIVKDFGKYLLGDSLIICYSKKKHYIT